MRTLGTRCLLRHLVVAAAGVAPLFAAAWLTGRVPSAAGGPFAALVLSGARATAWVVAAWWALVAIAAVHDSLTVRPERRWRWGPARLRRLLLVACGVGLVAGAGLSPARAAGPSGSPLPSPERPVGAAPASTPIHVVRPGESLWRIAAAQVPDDPVGISRLTDRIYRLNRAAIGSDPDLLLPGTRLELPTTDHPTEEQR